ncbi:cell envelope integrity protein TolA, partial [Francisellaceae bacterium]|nr:cell envelope integrity protein TolA [Francisellaceae bacterium]
QAQAAMEALAKKKAQEAEALAKRNSELAKTTNKYITLIQQTIRANWIDHGNLSSQLSVKVSISLSPSGRVQSVNIIDSSGNSAYDRQAVLAIEKSSPLPIPTDPELVNEFRKITLTLGGNN